ncbi:MAG TPA: S41 family peptidase [Chitinophagales bacterium]|nr:S41 family peptidase [Chitinophagales bacterium]
MHLRLIFSLFILFTVKTTFGQDYGNLPKISRDKLHRDLELLYQGLDKFHSGMYWYTPKDSVDLAFEKAKQDISYDMNIFEFYKIIAPLVALSREDHTDIFLPKETIEFINKKSVFLPITVVFLGTKLFCVKNGSNYVESIIEGAEIELINGESPIEIANKIGSLFASDGYIQNVKLRDLIGFNFSKYHFYYYGNLNHFAIKFKNIKQPIIIESLSIDSINQNFIVRNAIDTTYQEKDLLEYKIINDSTAYLGLHSFYNAYIQKESSENNLKAFLVKSLKSISENNIKNLVIDLSNNGGGTEGNEGWVYSYLGENYQKYLKVRAKTQKAILDNGIDSPIVLKTFGFIERIFVNKKMKDGSLERREWIGYGLKAYKKEPKYKFAGKLFVIISPVTYSGGSELSNMLYSNDKAIFVGEETGGGYLGNTSGYSRELTLPHSKITIDIPALQFVMNVKPQLPFGRGVIPHYEVIPTFEQYINRENAALEFILKLIEHKK